MNPRLFAVTVLAVALIYTLLYAHLPWAAHHGKSQTNPTLAFYSTHLEDLSKVTPHPLHMSQAVMLLCVRTPLTSPGPHANRYFDVYISKPEAHVIQTGKGAYPEGTVILKRKYVDAEGRSPELFTGMIKRWPGYNPTSGDWEYFVTSGDGQTVQQNGKLQSCMQCHQAYANSDFVTREYFKGPQSFTDK